MPSPQHVLLTHGDSVVQVPSGFKVISRIGDLAEGIEHAEKKIYGVQFHPEVLIGQFLISCSTYVTFFFDIHYEQVDLTENGKEMFKNFLERVAKVKGKPYHSKYYCLTLRQRITRSRTENKSQSIISRRLSAIRRQVILFSEN